MKNLFALVLMFASTSALAAGGMRGEKFQQVIYLGQVSATQSVLNNGFSAASPKGFVDGNLWAIPANTVVENVYLVIDSAITGTTQIDLGDADDGDGFASTNGNLSTPDMYLWKAQQKGAYLYNTGAVRTASAKFYSAAGKYLAIDVTGTNTAGTARVVIEGYRP